MKRTLSTISCAIFAIFTIVSCSEPDASNPANPDSGKPHDLSYRPEGPQNGNNPEDSVGFYHNQLIRYFTDNGADQSTDANTLIDMTGSYFSNIYGQKMADSLTTIMKKPENIAKLENQPRLNQKDLSDSLETWNAEGKISDAILPYYQNVVASLDDIDTKNLETGYTPVVNEIKSIERNVNGNSEINPKQKKKFYAFSSVGRFSTYHWFKVKTNLDPKESDIDWGTVIGIAVADCEGAAEGAENPYTEFLAATGQEYASVAIVVVFAVAHSFFSYMAAQN